MWSGKRFILVVAVVVVMLGSLGGIVLAQTGDGDDSLPRGQGDTLWQRALEIYQEQTGVAIDQAVLKDAFTQAQSQWHTEATEARQTRLQEMLEQGKLTQEQFDRMQARMEAWSGGTARFGLRGHGGFHGGGGHWGGRSGPAPTP